VAFEHVGSDVVAVGAHGCTLVARGGAAKQVFGNFSVAAAAASALELSTPEMFGALLAMEGT